MKERPILFSGAMVRALLDGTKTQTRRVCKPAEAAGLSYVVGIQDPRDFGQRPLEVPGSGWFGDEEGDVQFSCPYGRPGDRLWVREAHHRTTDDGPVLIGYEVPGENQEYEVPGIGRVREFRHHFGGWGGRASRNFPSIHMPRWASRITLEVTGVRVERLQDISEADAIAEGVCELPFQAAERGAWWTADPSAGAALHGRTPLAGYRLLWEQINRAGSWDANPLVWVVEFRRIAAEIGRSMSMNRSE